MLRNKISDLITNELFERFGSPSAAVIGVKLADEILALPEFRAAIAAAARERGDAKQAPSEGPQSGAESASPDPHTDNHP